MLCHLHIYKKAAPFFWLPSDASLSICTILWPCTQTDEWPVLPWWQPTVVSSKCVKTTLCFGTKIRQLNKCLFANVFKKKTVVKMAFLSLQFWLYILCIYKLLENINLKISLYLLSHVLLIWSLGSRPWDKYLSAVCEVQEIPLGEQRNDAGKVKQPIEGILLSQLLLTSLGKP